MGEPVEPGSSPGSVQSIERAIMLLEAISTEESGNRLTDLANRTGLAPSTVHRILTTLESRQFIRFSAADHKWCIGWRAFTIGSVFVRRRGLASLASPHLRQLRDRTRENVNLGLVEDGEIVFVDRAESREIARSVAPVGGRVPMTASAMGKAVLAARSREDLVAAVARTGRLRFTANTLVGEEALRSELEKVRRDGYSVDDEEMVKGLRCVAAAILDHHGEAIGAISISSATARIGLDRVPALGRLLSETSDRLTRALGGVAFEGAAAAS